MKEFDHINNYKFIIKKNDFLQIITILIRLLDEHKY